MLRDPNDFKGRLRPALRMPGPRAPGVTLDGGRLSGYSPAPDTRLVRIAKQLLDAHVASDALKCSTLSQAGRPPSLTKHNIS